MSRVVFHAPYTISKDAYCFGKETKEGWVCLNNFLAQINEELVYHDGNQITTILKISGSQFGGLEEDGTTEKPPKVLPTVHVTASEFASGSWIGEKWGMQTIVYPTPNAAQDLRACIQIASAETSKRVDIYTHTGWTTIGGKPAYLTTSGAITAKGLNGAISVQLPKELERFTLPKPDAQANDFAETMRLVNLGPKNVTWVLLLAAVRAALGNNDFAVHLAGRTGTYKSEISSLFQSLYGSGMDARHLPCSWNSTGNALEALCYRTKDALVVVDDFVPQGTSYAVRALQQKADGLIRAQGNQTGRSRLTDISNIQNTMFPRGIILSTGEDIPEGHSVRGRMMIVELSPGSVDVKKLTDAQKAREAYPRFMASFIQWWAAHDLQEAFTTVRDNYRTEFHGTGHARTPSIMGELIATAFVLKEYADNNNFFPKEMDSMLNKAIAAITYAGQQQIQYLHGTDPVTMFAELLRSMMATGAGHMKTRTGGIPQDAPAYGWQVETTHGEVPTYKSHGPKLGWIDNDADELYFDPNAVSLVKAKSGGKLAVTNQILIKRLKEGGMIARWDESRQRNTLRVVIEGHPQNVMILRLSSIMDLANAQNEVGSDEQPPE